MDKTGQRKPNQNFSQLSSAITQGSEVWVVQALKEVGDSTWFTVVERIGLDNLVKERQLIKSTREVYEGKEAIKLKSGSKEPGRNIVASISKKQLEEIAKKKMKDLNAHDLEQATKIIMGSARSMGIEVKE
mgnify:CR=1 FL=1